MPLPVCLSRGGVNMANNKMLTVDNLGRFKEQQDLANALTFLARIVYSSLPTTNNYAGRLAFNTSDGNLYVYKSDTDGWKQFATLEEIEGAKLFETDENGAIMPTLGA